MVDKVLDTSRVLPDGVIVVGATGNPHRLTGDFKLFEDRAGNKHFIVGPNRALLVHECSTGHAHNTIDLPEGSYSVCTQKEQDHIENIKRDVID
jgi:hypothetical protein